MSYRRSQERNRRLKKLYSETKTSYVQGLIMMNTKTDILNITPKSRELLNIFARFLIKRSENIMII